MSLKDKKYFAKAVHGAVSNSQPSLKGDALKQATDELEAEIQTRIAETQNGVGTFFDNGFIGLLKELRQLDKDKPWEKSVKRLGGIRGIQLRIVLPRLQRFLSRRTQGRFVDFQKRFRPTLRGQHSPRDIGMLEFAMSQGVAECMHWKSLPLFKTVFDFSLYSMLLWNLKPKTIIELGSGTGASSIWLADLMTMFGIDGNIYSVDLNKPELQYEAVTFIQGDCRRIDQVFTDDFLTTTPHPWLLVEDAHVNVCGVLNHFHRYLESGDYVVLEDSDRKRDEISQFVAEHPGCYKVDTHYTDFFGRNATCAQDSILVRI
jgi:cephalosporin hydroxylase